MLPDLVSNPGPLTYESGVLPIALRGPALVISGQTASDHERLCAMEPCLLLRRFRLKWGSNLRLLDQ